MSVRAIISLFLIIVTQVSASRVSAHGDEPRLEINVERVNPGGVVDVRGVDFDYEQVVTLTLETTGIVVQLGEVVTDIEGLFVYFAALPVDLPQGTYHIRAVTEHHDDVLSPRLAVQGPATFEEGGGQGERDEDDGLLAPMPTHAPAVVPLGSAGPAAQQRPSTILILVILAILAVLAASRLRAARKG